MEKHTTHNRKDQIEEITRIVLQVIGSYSQQDKARKNRFSAILQLVARNWVVFLFVLSVISAFIGWVAFDISPFQPLEEIAVKQKEYRRKELQLEYKKRMVSRHLELANSLLNVSQLEAARKEFANALELDPDNIEAHLGRLKAEIFNPIVKKEYVPEIAEKKLNLILKEYPNDPQVLSFLGDVYRNISKERSLEYYRKAVSQDPSVASAYQGMAIIYDMEKNKKEAIKMYEKALSLSKWNQTYLNNLGYQYLQRRDYKSAIEKYELLLNLDYRYLLTYYTLSNAYRLSGNFTYASWYQEQLINLLTDDKVISLARNQGEWFFHTDIRVIHFYDYPMKKCYAYYNAALTAHLLNDNEKADSYITKAKNTNTSTTEEWLVKKLIRYDVKMLKETQQVYSKQLDAFIEEYL